MSSTAIAHIDNLFPAGVATPRKRKTMVGPATPCKTLAFTSLMNFYIATISGARSFAI